MRNMLLAAAATLAPAVSAAPAAAQSYQGTSFAPPMTSSASTNLSSRPGDGYDGRSDMRRRARTGVFLNWYGGEWARYNNRSWDADSYNDWWHDRPDRAYPRWVTQNQGCERKWFSGDVLHC